MLAVSRSSAPTNADEALARDERLAERYTADIRKVFRQEMRRVVRSRGRRGFRRSEWENALARMWLEVGDEVFRPALVLYTDGESQRSAMETRPFGVRLRVSPIQHEHLVGAPSGASVRRRPPRPKQQLVALVDELIQNKGGARTIDKWIRESADGIIKTTRRRISTVVRDIGTGADFRDVERALLRLYKTDFVSKRANRIALDQVLRSTAEYEHQAGLMAQQRFQKNLVKVWRTQGDNRVRRTHQEASGQAVELDKDFEVGGALLRYPRDITGPARETAGCRCWCERREARDDPPRGNG